MFFYIFSEFEQAKEEVFNSSFVHEEWMNRFERESREYNDKRFIPVQGTIKPPISTTSLLFFSNILDRKT
jgi:hypothetical protein